LQVQNVVASLSTPAREKLCSAALMMRLAFCILLQFVAHCFRAANKARKAQEKAARAEVEQGAAAAQAKATAVRRNVAQKVLVAEAPMSELQKKLMARQSQK
jgi:hypothetical protein